ncbi:hypothetical protein ACOSQ2_005328 [Xanthoceras sorbifolium]
MTAASSSFVQHASHTSSQTTSTLDKPMIPKSLNFNLQIKLNQDNYIYWKTLVLPSIRTLELEDFITGERLCPTKFVEVNLKKGSSSIADSILKVKGIGDGLRSAVQVMTDRDLLLNVLNGLGHEFNPLVVMITSQQNTISLHEAKYMLMIHEQRIEHLNTDT